MRLDALFAQEAEVPFGEGRLGAVRSDAHEIDLVGEGPLDVLDRAPARQQEDPELAVREGFARDGQHLVVVQPGESDLERGRAQPVAVADLDHRNACRVRRPGVRAQLVGAEAVPDGVVAVPQARVVDLDRPARGLRCCRLGHDSPTPAVESRSAA